jgi:putative aldouronate transport system substrate-binding protein
MKELEKRCNVDIVIQGPMVSGNDYYQAVNVLLASGDLPDLIWYDWSRYSGGLPQAVADGIAVNYGLNQDYMVKLPNWLKRVNSTEYIRKSVILDEGGMALFPQVEEDALRYAYQGVGVRQDWLDRVGLKPPATVDELYTVLKAFKTKDANGNGDPDDEIPFSGDSGLWGIDWLIAPYGLKDEMFYSDPHKPGKLTYWTEYKDGQPFTDALTTLAKWYQEGLFEPDWLTQTGDQLNAKILNDKVGMTHMWTANYEIWRDTIRKLKTGNVDNVRFYGMEPLVGPEGVAYSYINGFKGGASATNGTIITKAAEKAGKMDAALRLLDYMYSPEGTELISFGVKGVTFTEDPNGQKYWTDEVSNDPKTPLYDKLFEYCLGGYGDWPRVMNVEVFKLIEVKDPDTITAFNNYGKGSWDLLCPTFQLTIDETSEYNPIMNDIQTAVREVYIGILSGKRSPSEIPAMLRQVKSMGIQRATQIYQEAYDRYLEK